MGLYIFFLPFKYKVEYAVILFPRKRGKKKVADLSPLLYVSGLSGHSVCVKSANYEYCLSTTLQNKRNLALKILRKNQQ